MLKKVKKGQKGQKKVKKRSKKVKKVKKGQKRPKQVKKVSLDHTDIEFFLYSDKFSKKFPWTTQTLNFFFIVKNFHKKCPCPWIKL